MRIRFWGTRGSIARPGPATLRHGGNTSCVEVVANDGTWVVLDCGTGAYELSRDLRRRGPLPAARPSPDRPRALGSHPGLPVLRAALRRAQRVARLRGRRPERPPEADASPSRCRPSTTRSRSGTSNASMRFRVLTEGSFEVGGIRVTAQYLHHPALTLGYRLEADGVVAGLRDRPRAARRSAARRADRRCSGASRGSPARRLPRRRRSRHPRQPVHARRVPVPDVAGDTLPWNAPSTTRSPPERSGSRSSTTTRIATTPRSNASSPRRGRASREVGRSARGLRRRRGAGAGACAAPAEESAPTAPGRGSALLASASPAARTRAARGRRSRAGAPPGSGAARGRLRLVQVAGLAAALDVAQRDPPSLLLLDLGVPRGELLAACRTLRSAADPRLRDVPLLLVADSAPSERELREAFEAGATDYLSRPIKPTLLRSRIRGWLMRSQPQ